MTQPTPEPDEWEPGRWWRVLYRGDRIWCETSSEKEAREALATAPGGGTLQRIYQTKPKTEWRADR